MSEIRLVRVALHIAAALFCVTAAACSPGATTAPDISQVNPGDPRYSKLQFAVGTANLYGTVVGLNVVSTLRQPNGRTAVGASTPTLTGPFTFTAAPQPAAGAFGLVDPYTTIPNGGPSLPETSSSHAIGGTAQTVALGTPYCDALGAPPPGFTACPPGIRPNATSFGQSGGVFATGLAPANAFASAGQSYSYAPYAQPLYDFGDVHTPFVPWTGPPAIDPSNDGMGTRDGTYQLNADSFGLPYPLGIGLGLTAFEGVTPRSGSYRLDVRIGFLDNSGKPTIVTLSSAASLSAARKLSTLTAPALLQDSSGGASFRLALPGDVTEALVQIVDFGPGAVPARAPGVPSCSSSSSACPPKVASNCQGPLGTQFAPVYYTLEVTHSGTYSIASNHGPNTNTNGGKSNLRPSPTLCTAAQNKAAGFANVPDAFSVQVIGFDYPAFEMARSLEEANPPQAPPISGPGGQSDVTVSAPIIQNCGALPASQPDPDCVSAGSRPRPSRPPPHVVPLHAPAHHDDRFRR